MKSDPWHKKITKSKSIDWVCDTSQGLNSCSLFQVALTRKNELETGAYGKGENFI